MLRLFKKVLPCSKEGCLAEGEVPLCMRGGSGHISCPVSVKLRDSLEKIKGTGYRGGYSFMAWVVLKGPSCELVGFQNEPSAEELKQRYGDRLITIVPI